MTKKDQVAQARANTLKVVRAAIRLRHSIAADNELNEMLPEIEKKFNAAVLRGNIPAPLDVKKALGLG